MVRHYLSVCTLIIATSARIWAQPATTTLIGPVYDTFGHLYSGQINVKSQVKTSGGWAITGTYASTFSIINGNISLALVPNDTAIPSGTSYAVTFVNSTSDKWTCIVPTSPTPVAFTGACTPMGSAPSPAIPIAVSQLIPSTTDGYFLSTVNGIVTWQAGVPGSGTVTGVGFTSTPAWLSGIVTNPTTSAQITLSASPIPNNALANNSITFNGVTCALGSAPCLPISSLSNQVLVNNAGTIAGSSSLTFDGTTLTSPAIKSGGLGAGLAYLTSLGLLSSLAPPPTGTWCAQSVNGVLGWGTCTGSGGTLTLSTLTNSQLLSLTNSQLLSLTN